MGVGSEVVSDRRRRLEVSGPVGHPRSLCEGPHEDAEHPIAAGIGRPPMDEGPRLRPRRRIGHGEFDDLHEFARTGLEQRGIADRVGGDGIGEPEANGERPEFGDLRLSKGPGPPRTIGVIGIGRRGGTQRTVRQQHPSAGPLLDPRHRRRLTTADHRGVHREPLGDLCRIWDRGRAAAGGRDSREQRRCEDRRRHASKPGGCRHPPQRTATGRAACGYPSTMRASVSWINAHLDPPCTADEQDAFLTAVGFPIDDRGEDAHGETWLEVEITSNRGDCLAHAALAREIAAVSGRTYRPPATPVRRDRVGPTPITVLDRAPERCPLYTAQVIEGVTVGPSPEWMRRRLEAIGQIPRNVLVDCTNYVLWELGQPTHVFDLGKLQGDRIEIRGAAAGERFLPLGEGAAELDLAEGDLVIADATRAVALAGIKGGAATAVDDATTAVLVEAATFDPVSVRTTSRRLNLRSDSSFRFERGVHPAEVGPAADRLVELILELAGGRLVGDVVADGAAIPGPRHVALRSSEIARLLGIEIPETRIAAILDTLGFACRIDSSEGGTVFRTTVPPRRMDVEREVDLVEEICRIHGLDAVPLRERIEIRPPAPQHSVQAVKAVRDQLAASGFVESVCHSLIGPRLADVFLLPGERLLQVDDDRAGGTPFLRPSLLPSLLEVLARNEGVGVRGLAVFEVAASFRIATDGETLERRTVGMAVDGGEDAQSAYRRLRGAVERLAERVSGRPIAIAAEGVERPGLRPAASISFAGDEGVELGVIGLLATDLVAKAGLDRPVAVAELDLSRLIGDAAPTPAISEPPQHPSIERDLSVVVAESVAWDSIDRVVRDAVASNAAPLEGLEFIECWRGRSIGEDRKSVTLRMVFRHSDRTLRHEEVDPTVAAVQAALGTELSAEIRGGS